MGYEINTGPFDTRVIGDGGAMGAHCVDIHVIPPFNPGEGLKAALGLSNRITFDHVSTTEDSTHMYVEVPAGCSDNAERLEVILDRLETYMNRNTPESAATNATEEEIVSYRINLL